MLRIFKRKSGKKKLNFPREMFVVDEQGEKHKRLVLSKVNGKFQAVHASDMKKFSKYEPVRILQYDHAIELND